jgi:hypothetical protein
MSYSEANTNSRSVSPLHEYLNTEKAQRELCNSLFSCVIEHG